MFSSRYIIYNVGLYTTIPLLEVCSANVLDGMLTEAYQRCYPRRP